MAFEIVHERGACNNALSFEMMLFKHIGSLRIEFLHPEEEPPRIGHLEASLEEAIKLRDALTLAIDTLQKERVSQLEDALKRAKNLKGKSLRALVEAFIGRDD